MLHDALAAHICVHESTRQRTQYKLIKYQAAQRIMHKKTFQYNMNVHFVSTIRV